MVEAPPEVRDIKMAEEIKSVVPLPRDITPEKIVRRMDAEPTKKISEETVLKRRKRGIIEEPARVERRYFLNCKS